jgi:hypothetical protein
VTNVRGTLGGSVIKKGTAIEQPLRNARLELIGGQDGERIARSDAGGRFVFGDLAPGTYRLSVTADGFIRQEFATSITIDAARRAANVVFELDPAPTAAGWVLDIYGDPIPNIMISALRRSYDVRGNPQLVRAATAMTDDRGEYRIFWLDPGEYFFYAASPPDSIDPAAVQAVAPTYYPGVNTPEEAKALRLDIGREMRVDFRLRAAALWSVTGQSLNGNTGRSTPATISLSTPAGDPSLSRYYGQSSSTGLYPGQFSISKVPPGSYILTAKSGSGESELLALMRIVLRPVLVASPPYTVSLVLSPPLTVNGRMFIESRQSVDLRESQVALLSVDADFPSPRVVHAGSNGQFSVNGVQPGDYVLELPDLPLYTYLKAARFGRDDILEKPLTLGTRELGAELQILLGADGGRLETTVLNENSVPQSGVHVVLVPDASRRHRREQYRAAITGDQGRASMRGIPPGRYKVFAWENLEPNAYLNADFIRTYEALGVNVDVAGSDNRQISVQAISDPHQ